MTREGWWFALVPVMAVLLSLFFRWVERWQNRLGWKFKLSSRLTEEEYLATRLEGALDGDGLDDKEVERLEKVRADIEFLRRRLAKPKWEQAFAEMSYRYETLEKAYSKLVNQINLTSSDGLTSATSPYSQPPSSEVPGPDPGKEDVKVRVLREELKKAQAYNKQLGREMEAMKHVAEKALEYKSVEEREAMLGRFFQERDREVMDDVDSS